MGNSYQKPKAVESKLFPEFFEALPSMEGKNVVITGCTTGTGLICARTLALKGASVVMVNRPSERATAAFEEVSKAASKGKVVQVGCDLQSFDSVKEGAAQIASEFSDGIDVLCNNAGIMAVKDAATKDGCCVQMQTNHLSHFLLTQQLWPLLTAAADQRGEARVVNHSSVAARQAKALEARHLGRHGGDLGGDDLGSMPMSGPRWERYSQTKLANVAFTYALRDRAASAGSKVKSLVAHPGIAATNLFVTSSADGAVSGTMSNLIVSQSAEDGAMGILRCCCDPEVRSGDFYGPKGNGMAGKAELLPPMSTADDAARSMLWVESEKSTGVEFKI